ncbi:uncharacterized protein LOC111617836 isoform X2 [Centruroides sculpturatus]|uniref:uncharacterized protein LOC111617836 isoform X2 n=1 Tax=Centruroides sculpturatus TaxID=218467 RepID=UPI000C6C9612|nr:uncharacterized protein LOC111617836 isoform X2 [Centruroides sculpturatus]
MGKTSWRNHHCPAPRSPVNGLSFIFRDGEVVQYTCHPGYKMIGRHYAYCVNNRWNSNTPRCVPNNGYEEFRGATTYTIRPGIKESHLKDRTSTERPLFHWEDKPHYPPYGDRENRLPLINGIWAPSRKPENILSIGTTTRTDNSVEELIEKEKQIAELRQKQLEEVKNKRYGYTTYPQSETQKSVNGRYHGSIDVVVLPPAPAELTKPGLFKERQKKRNKKRNRRKNKKHIQELRHKPEIKINANTDQGIITDSVVERKSRPYKPPNVPYDHHKLRPFDPRTSAYDSTCHESSHGITYPLRAPMLPNSIVWKYETHKHSSSSDSFYMSVRYKCNYGYRFQNERINKLYCQNRQWVGETPICVQ